MPGGFESYFAELGEIMGQPGPPDLQALATLADRYEIAMEIESIPRLAATRGLDLGRRP